MLTIQEIKQAVTKIGKKYGIKNAYLFGSYAKGKATEHSDVDLLVNLGEITDYYSYEDMRLNLAKELGTNVDMISSDSIKPRFYDLIKNDRILLYGA